jgi:sigma-E factor negative regulatory protein RseB
MTAMRRTLALSRFVVLLSVLFAFSAQAENREPSADRREASSWLKKIQTAAQRLDYAGTFVYQQGNQMRTSRIAHLHDGRNEFEKLEILDGRPREYIRSNEEVICYVPDEKMVLVEKRVAHDTFPGILAANPADLSKYYDIRKDATGRVAGHECQAILLEPRDKLRYGYKLWADKTTGLLLRAQTLDDRQEVVEQIAFTDVKIGNIERSRVKTSYTNIADWRMENTVMSPAAPSGWAVRDLPPGFSKIREVKRLISDPPEPGAAVGANGEREVLQLVFSDGLAAISVFVEPGSRSRTEGSLRQGALNIIGKRQGEFWLTIVGEVPLAAIRQVANSIEFKSRNE